MKVDLKWRLFLLVPFFFKVSSKGSKRSQRAFLWILLILSSLSTLFWPYPVKSYFVLILLSYLLLSSFSILSDLILSKVFYLSFSLSLPLMLSLFLYFLWILWIVSALSLSFTLKVAPMCPIFSYHLSTSHIISQPLLSARSNNIAACSDNVAAPGLT